MLKLKKFIDYIMDLSLEEEKKENVQLSEIDHELLGLENLTANLNL